MIPTGAQVSAQARAIHLGDVEIAGGQLWPDTVLLPHVQAAYTVMFGQMINVDATRARRTAFYSVPAYTVRLTPAAMGISNFGEPKCLWERSVKTVWTATVAAVNAATAIAPPSVDLTITNHGLSTGNEVVTYNFSGLTEDMNDLWTVTVLDANTVRLLGCAAAASPTGSNPVGTSGAVSNSTEDFPIPPNMTPYGDVYIQLTPNSLLGQWAYANGQFRFPASTTQRMIKVLYTLSGSPPATMQNSLGVDNCLDFMAAMTAGYAANSRGATAGLAPALFSMAVGNPSGDPGDGSGGLLGAFLRPGIKALQDTRVVVPPYRQKRNTGWWVNY